MWGDDLEVQVVLLMWTRIVTATAKVPPAGAQRAFEVRINLIAQNQLVDMSLAILNRVLTRDVHFHRISSLFTMWCVQDAANAGQETTTSRTSQQ